MLNKRSSLSNPMGALHIAAPAFDLPFKVCPTKPGKAFKRANGDETSVAGMHDAIIASMEDNGGHGSRASNAGISLGHRHHGRSLALRRADSKSGMDADCGKEIRIGTCQNQGR